MMIFGMEGRPLLPPSVFALKKAAIVYYNVLFATMTILLWLPRHHQIKWYLSIIPWITDIVRTYVAEHKSGEGGHLF